MQYQQKHASVLISQDNKLKTGEGKRERRKRERNEEVRVCVSEWGGLIDYSSCMYISSHALWGTSWTMLGTSAISVQYSHPSSCGHTTAAIQ